MLPICLGEATRLAGEVLEGHKAYRFGLRLGERSATGDAEGPIVERCAVPALTRESIEAALSGFIGTQAQILADVLGAQALGQPLYRLARQGVTVERAARAIQIEVLQLLEWQAEQPELRVLCSSGTYVRVLAGGSGARARQLWSARESEA